MDSERQRTFSSLEVWYQINFATGLALIAAGVIGGVLVLVLNYDVTALKPEPRYIVGILLTALVTVLFLLPVAIYSNRF
jgi:hypothetical protein